MSWAHSQAVLVLFGVPITAAKHPGQNEGLGDKAFVPFVSGWAKTTRLCPVADVPAQLHTFEATSRHANI